MTVGDCDPPVFCGIGGAYRFMGFTTQVFLYVFFPFSVAAYVLCVIVERQSWVSGRFARLRIKDWLLFVVSLAFYGWARIAGVKELGLYIVAVYFAARLIEWCKAKKLVLPVFQDNGGEVLCLWKISFAKMAFVCIVLGVLFILFRCKYWNFAFGKPIHAAFGISFLTFSALSYLIDVYKEKAKAGSFLDCAIYLSFFPKVVSGPIVLWRDFQPQIAGRMVSLDDAVNGINRIMIGFAKKLILADMFGTCIAEMDSAYGIDVPTAWGAVLLYMLEIYYDFSGYSDIAIGLALLFGFRIKENFDFPYRSCSITEFWRRWHISLGTWLREYVYIPLGGSKMGQGRTLINLTIVFLLTGIWHGAGWSYVLWGGINGVCVLCERIVWDKPFYQKIPKLFKWCATSLVTMFCWELFRFETIGKLCDWLRMMVGVFSFERMLFTWEYFFTCRIIFLTVVAMLGATILGAASIQDVWKRFVATKWGFAVQEVGVLALFAISILCMVNTTYKPFIYFQY